MLLSLIPIHCLLEALLIGSFDLVQFVPILVKLKCRHGPDVAALCCFVILVDINLKEYDVVMSCSQLMIERLDPLAWSTPVLGTRKGLNQCAASIELPHTVYEVQKLMRYANREGSPTTQL